MSTTNPRRRYEPEQLRRAGRRVVEWRLIHNFTQRTFAKRAGVSIAAVQSLEAGTRQTRETSLTKIALAMTLTLDELLGPLLAPFDPACGIAERPDYLGELLPDTIDVAYQYQSADGELKTAIKETLRAYYTGQLQRQTARRGPALLPEKTADAIDHSQAIVTRAQALRKRKA